jgi:hypothetical protein
MGSRKFLGKSKNAWHKSLNDHIGRFTDRLTLEDLLTISVGVWSAIHTQHPINFLTGALGYKLATTEGGTPPIAQITGLGILGTVAALPLVGGGDYPMLSAPAKELSPEEEADPDIVAFENGCPSGYKPQLGLQGWICKKV